MDKQSFQSWKGKFILSFLISERKVNMSTIGALALKQVSWWKKSIPAKRPALSYHADGLRVFVDVIEYPFEEENSRSSKVTNSSTYHYWEIPCKALKRARKKHCHTQFQLPAKSMVWWGDHEEDWNNIFHNDQILSILAEFFMQMCIEPSKHPM